MNKSWRGNLTFLMKTLDGFERLGITLETLGELEHMKGKTLKLRIRIGDEIIQDEVYACDALTAADMAHKCYPEAEAITVGKKTFFYKPKSVGGVTTPVEGPYERTWKILEHA